MRFRLLPSIIVCATLLLAIKTVEAVKGTQQLAGMLASPALAEEKEEKAEEAKKEDEAKEAEEEQKGEPKEEEKGEKKEDAQKVQLPTTPPEPSGLTGLKPEDRRFSPEEMELLQQLAKRREKLNQWEQNIALKENLLTAAEKRIDDKLAQLDAMKKELSGMLVQYKDQEDSKIKSLVRIYESMKPQDAARIFDEVEMPILLLVIDRMAEKKAAPILANMDPKKAKQLTVELAEKRKLEDAKLQAQKDAAAAAAKLVAPAK